MGDAMKKLVLAVLLIFTALFLTSCDNQKAGTFAVKFSWAKDGEGKEVKPDVSTGEFFVTVRIYEWKEGVTFPGDIAANGKQLIQSDPAQMKTKGTSIDFGDLSYGNRRFVVAEIRKGEELTGGVLFTGMSQLFDFKAGKHTEVNVEMSMTGLPGYDENGENTFKIRVFYNESPAERVPQSRVALRFTIRNANSVIIANDLNFEKGTAEIALSDLKKIDDTTYEYSPWNFTTGWEEIGDGSYTVFGKLKNNIGQISEPRRADVFLDTTTPVPNITPFKEVAKLGDIIEVRFSFDEQIDSETLVLDWNGLAFELAENKSDKSFTYTYTVRKEDSEIEYLFTLIATDLAGNKTDIIDLGKVRIDKTAPDLSYIAMFKNENEHGLSSNLYLKHGDILRFELEVNEEISDIPQMKLGIYDIPCEEGKKELSFDCSLTIDKDVTYDVVADIALSFNDIAGNIYSRSIVSGAKIDTQIPQFIFRKNKDPQDYNATDTIVLTITANEPVSMIEIDGTELDNTLTSWNIEGKNETGTHEVKLKAVDLAGNEQPGFTVGTYKVDADFPTALISAPTPDRISGTGSTAIIVNGFNKPVQSVKLNGTECIGEGAKTCTFDAPFGEGDKVETLTVALTDFAGNISNIDAGTVYVDRTEPVLAVAPLTRLNKPEECPLKNVSRATNGSSVEISFTVSEELKQVPVVKAYFEDAEIIFELSNQMGNFFSFVKNMDFDLTEGSYGLEIGLTDIVGNSRKIITEDSFEIKTANPQSPFVETEKIVYRRIPYGSSETGGEMSFRVKTEGENVVGEDVSFLVAYNSDDIENALEIGSAQAQGGTFDEFLLNRSDRTEVFLVAYDNACNRSDAVKVKNVEWTVSMGRKDQAGVNPHKFLSTPDFYETLAQDVRAFEPEDIQKLAMLNGTATEKKSFGRWDVLDQSYGETATLEGKRMIYDSNRGMVVIFSENGKVFEYDTRTNLFNKRNVVSLPPLSQGKMVYSPLNGKVIFFSYGDENSYVEVWEWDFETGIWEPKTVNGQKPGQGVHAIAYDSDRGKVILYGTSFSYSSFDPTVWEWDVENSSWEGRYPVVGESPFAWYSSAAYDSNRKKFVIFGGIYLTEEDIIWEWDTETGIWENRTLPGVKPEKRLGHSMIFDDSRNKIVMLGGTSFNIEGYQVVFSDTFDDLWEWDTDTGEWEEQVCGEPCQRTGYSMAYDPLRNKAVVFGGFSDASEEYEVFNDLWELDIKSGAWSEKGISFLKPNLPLSDQDNNTLVATAYDSDRDIIILFGNKNSQIEMWEWSNNSRTWKYRETAGVKPDASTSFNMKMVYDSDRKKCVLFGLYNNIWEWDIETGGWAERVTGEPKPAMRVNFSMVYDPARKKTIIYGGHYTDFTNDLWEWDDQNGTWIERIEAGIKPQARAYASMVYDADRNKVMLVGGFDWDNSTGSGIWIPLPELWEWNPETGLWDQKANWGLDPIGMPVYDSIRRKTVIYKGSDGGFIDWDGETETYKERTFEGESPASFLNTGFFHESSGKIILYDGNMWEYDFGFSSRPAHIMQTFFSDSKADSSVEITSIAAKFYSGGTGELDGNTKHGAELKIWRRGRWEKLAENTVSPETLSNNPANGLLEWVFSDTSQLKTLFYGSSKTLNLAVTPIAPNGEEEGVIATDYAEVVVRYRISEQ